MKKYLALFMLALIFCAAISAGCGGGSDSADSEQAESLTEDTGDYDPNEGGRSVSNSVTDLSTITAHYTAQNGETLTGRLGANVKISIAHGAAITLKDATINGVDSRSYDWAGINCEGDATIILDGINYVKGFYGFRSGIHVPQDRTLTIKGYGYLDVSSNGWAAAIGGGWNVPCGNIVIDGGVIKADGGRHAAAIGGARWGDCGDITITDNAQKVIAHKFENSSQVVEYYYTPHSIGAAWCGYCGTITIGDKVTGSIGDTTYTHNTDPKTTGTFTVDVKTTWKYRTNLIALYGRKAMYIKEDGTYALGGWEKVAAWKGSWLEATGDQHTTASREYVELGCEFDIAWGTDWPYSRPFWTADRTLQQQIDSVEVILSGYVRNADIKIKVNGTEVDSRSNCDSGKANPEWDALR